MKKIIFTLLLITMIPLVVTGYIIYKNNEYSYPPEVSINRLLNNILTHINSELEHQIYSKETNMDSLMNLISLYSLGNMELSNMLGDEKFSYFYHSELFYEYLNNITSDGIIQENEWATIINIQEVYIQLKKEQSTLINPDGEVDKNSLDKIYQIDKKVVDLLNNTL